MTSKGFFSTRGIEVPHGFGTKDLKEEDLLKAFRGLTPIRIKQVHGAEVLALRESDPIPQRAPYDAVVTNRDDCLLWVKTADCLPLLLWDPTAGAIGVVHAGWRGILKGVIGKAIEAALRTFGASPGDLVTAIGPCIRACCYEVGEEVAHAFQERFGPCVLRTERGKTFLDLPLCARKELESLGILRVEDIALCTYCTPELFCSFRRTRTRERQLNFITKGRPLDPTYRLRY